MGLALHNSPVDLAFAAKHFPITCPRPSAIRKPRSAHPKAVARALLERGFAPEDLPVLSREAHVHVPRRNDHRARRHHGAAPDSDHDGIRLARSTVPLPSDGSRDRVPSLERQNAFWDPRTTKRSPVAVAAAAAARLVGDDDDADVAELYRLGLLYDDDHTRGAGFGLDAIVRDEPVYSITTRAASHRRTTKRKHRGAAATRSRASTTESLALQMDWDFTGLEDDDDVARYLLSESREMAAAAAAEGRHRRGYRTVWRSLPAVDEPPAGHTPDLIPDEAEEEEEESDERAERDEDNELDDETEWAVLPRERDADDVATTTVMEDAATGVWIVLGDGS
ncbi:hypothetical protein VD0001_g1158 [Verticillium dahliae]|uniref:Uncharacterized protein n=1 Tax=Verticillium dahliae TaxID=27337 RepID=A0A444RSG7_VERDA|nr:hypothetical protein VD0001_g1158 [Verticillium dahliae]RXG44015.1 hypothetical protein VDGE_03644 [Verticillium dahliae]